MALDMILSLIFWLVALFGAIILHEYAHGLVAWRLGDPTAKLAGRLTLNPLAHIDLFGTVLLPLMLFLIRSPFIIGWAKPVPINPLYFRRPYRDMMLVGLAGPAMNFSLALLGAAVWYPLGQTSASAADGLLALSAEFLAIFILLNIILALFNLIPFPPLDGSRVVAYFLPPRWRALFHRLEPFGIIGIFLILILLQQTDILERLILPLARWLGLAF